MPEKIGVLFLQAQEMFGADAAVHADIMRHLDRSKFEVHVACTAGDGDAEPASLRILREIPELAIRSTRFAPSLFAKDLRARLRSVRASAGFLADFAALRRYARRHRIRVIHSTERPRDSLYNVALAKLVGAKSIVHVHVKYTKEYSKLSQWGVQHADAVFSISRFVTGTLVEMGRAPATIHTVLNGIEVSRWDPELDGSALRRELGLPTDALVLACVSRLFSWKGQRELVRAFGLASARFPDARLLIVGPDLTGGTYTAELKEIARSVGALERVLFTGPRSDVPQIMAACDVFAMASFEEPFGLVFLEAMAMKKPVLALRTGGVPEVVMHEQTGLLSPPWDVPALAANIETLLAGPELRARMGERGRARVLERFRAERVGRDAGLAYERVLGLDSR